MYPANTWSDYKKGSLSLDSCSVLPLSSQAANRRIENSMTVTLTLSVVVTMIPGLSGDIVRRM